MTTTLDFAALANAAAATQANQTQATAGGGDYTPPAAGRTISRLVGYVELGVHTRKGTNGQPDKDENQVRLIFELLGQKHPPQEVNGVLTPVRISVDVSLSLNEKAHFFKIFSRMNWQGQATHASQLLTKPFIVEVFHKARQADPSKSYATLKGPDGFAIFPPTNPDALTGEVKDISDKVPAAISVPRLFVWEAPANLLKPMWDSLFIDGAFPDGRTRNVLQEQIRAAKNFKDSPIYQLLQTGGKPLDLGAQATTPTTPAAQPGAQDDPLLGL